MNTWVKNKSVFCRCEIMPPTACNRQLLYLGKENSSKILEFESCLISQCLEMTALKRNCIDACLPTSLIISGCSVVWNYNDDGHVASLSFLRVSGCVCKPTAMSRRGTARPPGGPEAPAACLSSAKQGVIQASFILTPSEPRG